jgi:hypothetical protein
MSLDDYGPWEGMRSGLPADAHRDGAQWLLTRVRQTLMAMGMAHELLLTISTYVLEVCSSFGLPHSCRRTEW